MTSLAGLKSNPEYRERQRAAWNYCDSPEDLILSTQCSCNGIRKMAVNKTEVLSERRKGTTVNFSLRVKNHSSPLDEISEIEHSSEMWLTVPSGTRPVPNLGLWYEVIMRSPGKDLFINVPRRHLYLLKMSSVRNNNLIRTMDMFTQVFLRMCLGRKMGCGLHPLAYEPNLLVYRVISMKDGQGKSPIHTFTQDHRMIGTWNLLFFLRSPVASHAYWQ